MHLPAKQKLAACAAGLVMLGGVSYVGAQRLRPDAPLSVEPISGTAPTILSPPDGRRDTPIEPPSPAPTEVVVAVAGAVKTPGLLRLPPGARVDDAIKGAGGAKPDADLEAINLAAKLPDGVQVYVPTKRKPEAAKAEPDARVPEPLRGGIVREFDSATPLAPPLPTAQGAPKRGASKKKASGPVSLSTGSEAQLETLPGVGPSTAQRIIEYRMAHGGFATVEEITAVKGIGPKKFAKMKPFLRP